jgi:hypothetical protein
MIKRRQIWERVQRNDRIDRVEENTNVFSTIDDTNDFTNKSFSEGQPAVYGDKIIIKKDGALKQLVVDSDNNITLGEIENG